MADLNALTALIEPEARTLGFDLVRVRLFGAGDDRTLQVMAERPDTRQLTIDDCSDLSRRISDLFDEKDPIAEAYRLEVSSPGIDRPLTRLRDFADWAGYEARITLAAKLDGRRQFKGDLAGIDGDAVVIIVPDAVRHVIPFGLIEDAKLVMTDRLISATAPLSSAGADEVLYQDVPSAGADEPEFKQTEDQT